MTDENIENVPPAESAPAEPSAEPVDTTSAPSDAPAEEKPKRTRKPAAAKAQEADEAEAQGSETAEAAADDSETAEEPTAKPARKPRAKKPAPEAAIASADSLIAEGDAEEAEPAAAEKPKPAKPAAKSGKPAKSKPEQTGKRRPEPVAAPVVRAQAKYVRSSARKARLVCDHIRGKSVDEARAILAHTPRAVARDWSKLLESAVANAEHNHELDGEDLVIKAVQADEGPTIKRFRPRAQGRATRIRKRTSHLTILLTPKN